MINVRISDGEGEGKSAKVSEYGFLTTGPSDFNTSYPVTLSNINTAYNFVPPINGKHFVITGILLYANKGVGAADATVTIYESDDSDSLTESKQILTTEMLKQTSRDLTGLNILVSQGKFVNIKTDDNTIFASLLGYYVNNGL